MRLKLYYSPGACSMACHIALEEAAADVELVPVPLREKANRDAEYLKLHPRGFVPLLQMASGEHLTEAAAILLHIARSRPSAGLLPEAGSLEEARVFEWLAWLTNTLHIAYACLWRPERFSSDERARECIVEEAKARIAELNATIEKRIEQRRFAAGSSYSLADPYLLVFFRWANRIGLDAAHEHPAWSNWAKHIEQRPAVVRVLQREGISIWG